MPLLIASARRRLGVTLIELLAVLAVIAVLAALAIGRNRRVRERAEVARLQTEARELQRAQLVYHAETGAYYPGPFTEAATAAARFDFTVPPGRTLVVQEAGEDTWRGQLLLGDGDGDGKPAPFCAINLRAGPASDGESPGVACSLPSGHPGGEQGDESVAGE